LSGNPEHRQEGSDPSNSVLEFHATLGCLRFFAIPFGMAAWWLATLSREPSPGGAVPWSLTLALVLPFFGALTLFLLLGRQGVRIDPARREITTWLGVAFMLRRRNYAAGEFDRVEIDSRWRHDRPWYLVRLVGPASAVNVRIFPTPEEAAECARAVATALALRLKAQEESCLRPGEFALPAHLREEPSSDGTVLRLPARGWSAVQPTALATAGLMVALGVGVIAVLLPQIPREGPFGRIVLLWLVPWIAIPLFALFSVLAPARNASELTLARGEVRVRTGAWLRRSHRMPLASLEAAEVESAQRSGEPTSWFDQDALVLVLRGGGREIRLGRGFPRADLAALASRLHELADRARR
jgi:hypothetical protein